jgi:hypothetical protein
MALKESNTGPMVIKKNGGACSPPLPYSPRNWTDAGPMLDHWTNAICRNTHTPSMRPVAECKKGRLKLQPDLKTTTQETNSCLSKSSLARKRN